MERPSASSWAAVAVAWLLVAIPLGWGIYKTLQTVAMIALCAGMYAVLYRAVLPLALRLLEQRREIVLRAVTRE